MVSAQEQRRQMSLKRQQRRRERHVAQRVVAQAPAALPEVPTKSAAPLRPAAPVEPEVKPIHPWRRAWSVRRQRELAGAA